MERKHYLFTLLRVLSPKELEAVLWKEGWGYNALSHTFRGQIFTVRKLVPPRHQYHLRFYRNGDVSGHFEVDPFIFPLEHIDGVDLQPMNKAAITELLRILARLEWKWIKSSNRQ